jgi:hypothetical protein
VPLALIVDLSWAFWTDVGVMAAGAYGMWLFR